MLKRFYVCFLMSVLFAIAQTGIVTHEISHIQELSQSSQPDKKQGSEPCTLCIGLAHAIGALTHVTPWQLLPLPGLAAFASPLLARSATTTAVYRARAPPYSFPV